MPRARVLSFMSQWGGGLPKSPTSADAPSSSNSPGGHHQQQQPYNTSSTSTPISANTPSPAPQLEYNNSSRASPTERNRSDSRLSQRPLSMVQTYHPAVMDVAQDTLPELQPIFTYLNSHSNKLYQEGYFLKLNDLDSRGRPSADRMWSECYAQLVGTVLSLWDAALLDQAGQDGEVVPTFINLADASIKMIPSLPMNGAENQNLQNVLSVSTAAKNRYLFHFNSLNSLTQWTAGIRLAMYEHATLQEAYTGSLIAGKGKTLNSIKSILERTRMKHEDWARVRFGAGTPWRRCWCVVSPPDEKEYQKLQKSMKKQSIYDRSKPVLKGDIKFYENKKVTKKSRPIATITDAYSAYAVFPQSKPLIDQSTLIKVEGRITIHSSPESKSDGFVFIMPEVHPAVSGFEMMLRFLFPVFDTFALYGRPDRLVADVLDSRSLMFAMPTDRRYGYLDLLDVAGLIHTEGSQNWTDREWRKQLKELTAKRMTAPVRSSRNSSRRNTLSRVSLPPTKPGALRFEEPGSTHSQPSTRRGSPTRPQSGMIGAGPRESFDDPRRTDSAPPVTDHLVPLRGHQRSVSETNGYRQFQADLPSRARNDHDGAPPPPVHRIPVSGPGAGRSPPPAFGYDAVRRDGYDSDYGQSTPENRSPYVPPELQDAMKGTPPPAPVQAPPSFRHGPGQRPPMQPYQHPELLRANSNVDPATLQQMADANHAPAASAAAAAGSAMMGAAGAAAAAAWKSDHEKRRSGEYEQRPWEGGNYHGQYVDPIWGGPQAYRLPTIPASPYVEQDQPIMTPSSAQFKPGPPVPEHGSNPRLHNQQLEDAPRGSHEYGGAYRQGQGQSSRPQSGNSLHRKPVPGRSSTSSRAEATASTPETQSLNSLRSNVIEPEALDRLAAEEQQREAHERPETLLRQQTTSSSVYDDDASLASTDYASTESSKTKPPLDRRDVDRPRAGVLKTVGRMEQQPAVPVVVGDYHYSASPTKEKEEKNQILDIDFGPTYSYTPDSKERPGTSGTITDHLRKQSRSRDRLDSSKAIDRSPDEIQLSPYDRPGSGYGYFQENRAKTPNNRGGSSGGSRTASTTPPLTSNADHRRSLAWQPGMAAVPSSGHAARPSLTAEEWVQARASAAAPQPGVLRKPSPYGTSAMQRQSSGDWSQTQEARDASASRASHTRTPTAERLTRPHSRNASLMLQQQQALLNASSAPPTENQNPSLSAREQEFVARATGTPLLQLDKQKPHQRAPSAGLVGAIEAREKERRDIKRASQMGAVPGAVSTTVQNAVLMRQQQAAQSQAAQIMGRPSSMVWTQQQQPQQGMYAGAQAPAYSVMQQQNYSQPNLLQHQQMMGGGGSPIAITPTTPQNFSHPNLLMHQQQQTPSPTQMTPSMAGPMGQQGYFPRYSQQQMMPLQQQQQPQQARPYGASWDQQQQQQQQQQGRYGGWQGRR